MNTAILSRPVMDCEQLVVHKFTNGVVALAAAADVNGTVTSRISIPRACWRKLTSWFRGGPSASIPIPEVVVPPGTYLILKSIPSALRQRYGVEQDEGVVFVLRSDAAGRIIGALQCNNGAQIRLQDLREAQRLEVLSLALAGESFAVCAEPQMR
jgi:hypothetical protein